MEVVIELSTFSPAGYEATGTGYFASPQIPGTRVSEKQSCDITPKILSHSPKGLLRDAFLVMQTMIERYDVH